jgi:hypothetical protein
MNGFVYHLTATVVGTTDPTTDQPTDYFVLHWIMIDEQVLNQGIWFFFYCSQI